MGACRRPPPGGWLTRGYGEGEEEGGRSLQPISSIQGPATGSCPGHIKGGLLSPCARERGSRVRAPSLLRGTQCGSAADVESAESPRDIPNAPRGGVRSGGTRVEPIEARCALVRDSRSRHAAVSLLSRSQPRSLWSSARRVYRPKVPGLRTLHHRKLRAEPAH